MSSKTSSKTDVIENSELLPYNLWYEYCMEAQGYKMDKNTLYQDNKGAEK